MRIIAEAGNPDYYLARAFELARAGDEARSMDGDLAAYHENVKLAITLLALARASVGG